MSPKTSCSADRLIALAAVLLLSGGIGLARNKYEKWLQEEVVWIISEAEKKAFKKLEDDESREGFIEEFWRRRDPTPSTERNEYKEEHYRRLVFANEMFREGIPGWKTDRGRVFILHGTPDNESFSKSRSQISPTREIPSTARNPNTIVWSYHQIPDAKYYRGEIRLVFQPSGGMNRQSFVMGESKTAQDRAEELSRRFFPASDPNWFEADVRYRLVMAGPPAVINARGAELPNSGLGEFSRYLDDIFRSPGELLEERERERERRAAVAKELAVVDANVGFEPLEVALSCQAFWRGPGQWWLPLEITGGVADLGAERFDIYAALLDGDGQVFDEFVDSAQWDGAAAGPREAQELRYSNFFTAPSGDFLLRTVVRGGESRRTGITEQPVKLTEAAPVKVKLGGLLLTNRMELVPEGTSIQGGELGEGIVFERVRLRPSRLDRFRPDSYLFLYFQLWLPRESPGARVSVTFIREGRVVKRSKPRQVKRTQANLAEYGSAFPLEDLDPGRYVVQVQAIDHASRSYVIRRASFGLEPSPE